MFEGQLLIEPDGKKPCLRELIARLDLLGRCPASGS